MAEAGEVDFPVNNAGHLATHTRAPFPLVAAPETLTRHWATEFGGAGIRVNAVA
ncbi:hypothetical protein [Streptomyces sp. NPDC047841]|uniref:hypothetical protein n=1 Tax=Streptomyces sp. NPDC047841 TaxID=3154708 RepID=UPI003455C122